jgi:hypothetical protein
MAPPPSLAVLVLLVLLALLAPARAFLP